MCVIQTTHREINSCRDSSSLDGSNGLKLLPKWNLGSENFTFFNQVEGRKKLPNWIKT